MLIKKILSCCIHEIFLLSLSSSKLRFEFEFEFEFKFFHHSIVEVGTVSCHNSSYLIHSFLEWAWDHNIFFSSLSPLSFSLLVVQLLDGLVLKGLELSKITICFFFSFERILYLNLIQSCDIHIHLLPPSRLRWTHIYYFIFYICSKNVSFREYFFFFKNLGDSFRIST